MMYVCNANICFTRERERERERVRVSEGKLETKMKAFTRTFAPLTSINEHTNRLISPHQHPHSMRAFKYMFVQQRRIFMHLLSYCLAWNVVCVSG